MNDCMNAEMRDRLPDLLHEQLDAESQRAVQAHVDECTDCREELALLRSLHASIVRQTPRVDVAYVVGALPKAPAARTPTVARRRVWADWRIAAAVTLIAAGGSSFALMHNGAQSGALIDTLAPTRPAQVAPAVTPSVAPSVASIPESVSAKASGNSSAPTSSETVASNSNITASTDRAAVDPSSARLGDLTEDQLQSLLGQIDKLKAVPVAEPEPASLKVSGKTSSEIL
jgi:hypothetical protein